MPVVPFRETYTLSDAVELIGRRLYGETWTGSESAYSQPRKSPEEIVAERKPLEEELSAAETRIREIDAAIGKTMDDHENRRLAVQRVRSQSLAKQLRATLSLDHPSNDITTDLYNAHVRWKTTVETFLEAIKGFKLKVHDGRGSPLNELVWNDPRFRCYLDLSVVVNSKTAAAPRWQPARIDRDKFKNWLATVTPLVEVKYERSAEERLTEFLRQELAAMRTGPRRTKVALRAAAREKIGGVSLRMFERIWTAETPPESRKGGRPPKVRKSV